MLPSNPLSDVETHRSNVADPDAKLHAKISTTAR
jgi:hypothetical protein